MKFNLNIFKKGKYYKSDVPPLWKKECPVCMKITKFQYNRNIGHSECIKCGATYKNNPFI